MTSYLRRFCQGMLRLGILSLALCLAAACSAAHAAIVVEAIEPSLGADEAGLEVGDVLLTWRRQSADLAQSVNFESWLDLERLEYSESGRGPIEIRVERKGRHLRFDLPPRYWGIEARPVMAPGMLDALANALEDVGAEPVVATQAIHKLVAAEDFGIRSWALARLAVTLETKGELDASLGAWTNAAASVPTPLDGIIHWQAGLSLMRSNRLESADAELERALAIWQREDPGGLWVAAIEIDLGDADGLRFDLAAARRHYKRSYDIRRKLAPGSWLLAVSVRSLGVAAGRQNDLATADALFEEALELRLATGGSGEGEFNNLGIVSHLRGDYERAESYMRRALEIRRRESPGQEPLASVLMNLANTLSAGGNAKGAIELYDEALQIFERIEPGSQSIPRLLRNRGQAWMDAGDSDRAERDASSSLHRFRELGGSPPDEAAALHQLGEIAGDRGDLEVATARLTEALLIREQNLPDSSFVAYTAAALGRVFHQRGDLLRAEKHYRRAVSAIEIQQQRIGGGSRGLVAFRDKFARIYRDYIELLLESGRQGEAFRIYEQSRGQALRALLNQRDLDLSGETPPDLAAERQALTREIEVAYREFSQARPDALEDRRTLRLDIERLHARRDAVAGKVRALSQRMADLDPPPPLSAAAIQAALGPQTLLLAYSLGPERSTVFVLAAKGELEAFDIGAGADEISSEVTRWASLVQLSRGGTELQARTAQLTQWLLGPAEEHVARAQRLIVIPDGPLHGLSFAALHDPTADDNRYLIERLAIAYSVSGSVHARSETRRAVDATSVVAFGDPTYTDTPAAGYRRKLGSLPASRREAQALSAVYGDRAKLFLDREATEGAARRELTRAEIAHFACHALVDEQLPLDSALVLSPSEGDEGLLQAWEIIEDGGFAADLVVLSACETARGGQRAGEGIVGLVHAFQVAGVPNIIASLWSVADESTADFMHRFYQLLAGGSDTAEALRGAQLSFLSGPLEVTRNGRSTRVDLAEPRYWAPFVLIGRAN